MFDANNEGGLEELSKLTEEACDAVRDIDSTPFFLVGTKCDLKDEVAGMADWAEEEEAESLGLVSAKTGKGVEDVFKRIANEVADG